MNGKLEMIIRFNGQDMTSLEAENKNVSIADLTVELEQIIIRLGEIIDKSMLELGITAKQLQGTMPKEKFEHYKKCGSELKIIVNHLGIPFVSTSAENVLPHQLRQAFDGMSLSLQNSLDNIIRNKKLTPNSFPTRDMNKF